MKDQKLAQQILDNIGGKSNVIQHWHCITRLRFNLHDNEKVNMNTLSSLDGVMGVQFQGDQLQVILGNKVSQIFKTLDGLITMPLKENEAHKPKQNIINTIFEFLSGVFSPILPAIVGTGLLKGLLSLLIALNCFSSDNMTYKTLYSISEAVFYFLPFLVASSAAKKFKTHEYLAITLAAILLFPSLSASLLVDSHTVNDLGELIFSNREALSIFGIPMANNIDYHASVIPIILSVWLLSYIYRLVDKIIPPVLKVIASPVLVLLITSTIMLIVIAPLGFYIGSYIAEGFTFLFNVAGPLAGLIMGGGMALLVITGMHYAVFPACFENFKRLGYDFMLLPISFVSNLAQAGATLAVAIKVKNKEFKSLAYSSAFSATLGITEPAIYGVTTKLKKPFYAALIGGAAGGTIVGIFSVKVYQFSLPGLSSLPTYINSQGNIQDMLYIILGVSISFLTAFIITLCLKIDESPIASGEENQTTSLVKGISTTPAKTIELVSPITGELLELSAVPDNTFAKKIMGDGFAILPIEGKVFAPCSGVISVIAPTKHAIGIISAEGVELLIHVGIDTVMLEGEGFNVEVKHGQSVEKGDLILTFDLDLIKQKNIPIITPVIITNSESFHIKQITDQSAVIGGKDIILNLN